MNTLVKDVVCNMDVDPARAAGSSEYKDKAYYFCSPRCVERFNADPEKYLMPKPPAGQLVQLVGITPVKPLHTKPAAKQGTVTYVCPMDPEVHEGKPGPCPVCGMALESDARDAMEYTCPMHPEIIRDHPGACPICGMALEPRTAIVEEQENPELVSMTRRFWASSALAIPVLALGMSDMIPGQPMQRVLSMRATEWIQLLLATPVVIWGGWPFFQRGWASLVNRSLNMFTLIALGTGTAYLYSVI